MSKSICLFLTICVSTISYGYTNNMTLGDFLSEKLTPISTYNIKTLSHSLDTNIYVPKAFTPDQDGINDIFQPIISSNLSIEDYHLAIINREGQTVFETNDHNEYWTGGIGEQQSHYVSTDVFLWKIEIKFEGLSHIKSDFGFISIIR